jgi:CRP-like cAMP-binding protein
MGIRAMLKSLVSGDQKPDEEDDFEFLRKVANFRGLTDDQLRKIQARLVKQTFPAGKPIIREGEIDTDNTMYILKTGAVSITASVTMKTSQTETTQKEKSFIRLTGAMRPFFGDMSMFEEKGERSATVMPLEDCTVFGITRKDFEEVTAEDPAIGYIVVSNIARVLCDRLRKSNKDVLKLTTALSLALSR